MFQVMHEYPALKQTPHCHVKVYKLYSVKVNFVLIIKSIMFPAI